MRGQESFRWTQEVKDPWNDRSRGKATHEIIVLSKL